MTERTIHNPREAYVGKDLGSREFVATDELMENYFAGLEIDGSWYVEHSPFTETVAPSMVLTDVETGFEGAGFENSFGTLWMRQEWDTHAPIVPGERYKATSRVSDIYEHRGRTVVDQETTLWTLGGEMAARGRHHQSYMRDQSSGQVELRSPKSKEGVRRFAVPEGETIGSEDHTITLEMCGIFFHGNANYHTDKKIAEELGFPDVVVGGRMTLSYIGDMMDKRFGKGWYEGGSLDAKFTNIVWPGDTVITRGVITDTVEGDGPDRANVAVWMEKDDGTVVIVGNASALV